MAGKLQVLLHFLLKFTAHLTACVGVGKYQRLPPLSTEHTVICHPNTEYQQGVFLFPEIKPLARPLAQTLCSWRSENDAFQKCSSHTDESKMTLF